MVDIDELISDEEEAIRKYQMFLDQGFNIRTKRFIQIIKKIQSQEREHIKMLRSMK